MSKYTYIIDAGHGSIVDNKYVTAPKKMYKYSNDKIAYEGVINRIFAKKLINKLEKLEIAYISLYSNLDLPLKLRVKQINNYYEIYKNIILISLHSNAGKGTGIEIWTTKGITRSDKFAQLLGEKFIKLMPDIKFRSDTFTDGDLDKEANFYILKHVYCPALLLETMFFDNWSDYKKLIDPYFQNRVIDVICEWIKKVELMNI